jgi:hypothetical protein
LTFGWLLPLVRLGNSRPLKPEDLGELSTRDHVAPYLERFEAVVRGKGGLTPAKFRSAVWAVFSKDEWTAVACKIVGDAFAYLPPLCINWVVEYAEAGPSHEATTQWGMVYVVASVLLVAPAMTGLTYHWFYQVCVWGGGGYAAGSAGAGVHIRRSLADPRLLSVCVCGSVGLCV